MCLVFVIADDGLTVGFARVQVISGQVPNSTSVCVSRANRCLPLGGRHLYGRHYRPSSQ